MYQQTVWGIGLHRAERSLLLWPTRLAVSRNQAGIQNTSVREHFVHPLNRRWHTRYERSNCTLQLADDSSSSRRFPLRKKTVYDQCLQRVEKNETYNSCTKTTSVTFSKISELIWVEYDGGETNLILFCLPAHYLRSKARFKVCIHKRHLHHVMLRI